ncbi:MAG: sulfur oxidation c-type cytochrome SoxA [Gammaproteobacteria bacterium]|nr:sulfur oxidation c-type cytochrome SoxA [Gammaproteobacteria bacterium]
MGRSARAAALLAGLLLCAPPVTRAGPQQARTTFWRYFLQRFPGVRVSAYAHGVPALTKRQLVPGTPLYTAALAEGRRLWTAPFPNGHTYVGCFAGRGVGAAADYPRFDVSRGFVQTLEMALNACRVRNGLPAYSHLTRGPMADLDAYCKSLSRGRTIHITLPTPAAVRAFTRGEHFFWARRGQRNFSCATCHVQHTGQRLGRAILTAALGQGADFPLYRRATHTWVPIARQYRHCLRRAGTVPPAGGRRIYRDLLFYQMYLNNGLRLASPGLAP